MSLDDLLYPSLVLRPLKRHVPRLVVLSHDDHDSKGRELRVKELTRLAQQRRENVRGYERIKADPERLAKRRAQTVEWRKANPERVAKYREKYRRTESYRKYQRDWKRKNKPGTKGQPFGERMGSAKLTDARVVELRAMYAAGGSSIAKVAAAFGVSFSAAHKVINRLTWRHVP